MGGYALPKPVLNPPIVFSKSGRRHTLKNSAKPDLYWKSARLDLEYDSDEFHNESNRAIDSMRRKALERMNVEVVGLTHDELFSADLFHATVMRIARRLARRIRSEYEGDFIQKRSELRQALLQDNPTAPPHIENAVTDEQVHEHVAMQEDEAIAESCTNDIWLDEIPDEEPWSAEAPEDDKTWDVGFVEPDDEDLHVFGGTKLEAE